MENRKCDTAKRTPRKQQEKTLTGKGQKIEGGRLSSPSYLNQMTPKNYISTDPGSEQDFVDKQLHLPGNILIDWEKLEGEKFGATKTAS